MLKPYYLFKKLDRYNTFLNTAKCCMLSSAFYFKVEIHAFKFGRFKQVWGLVFFL